MQHLRADAEAFERAGPEVLDEHVGVVGQPQQGVATVGGLQVEHDGALVPAEQLPRVGVAALGWEPPYTPDTVSARRLDLHDVGAEVGEMAGRARPREHRRHVDHTQIFERLHARRLLMGRFRLRLPSVGYACISSSACTASGGRSTTTA